MNRFAPGMTARAAVLVALALGGGSALAQSQSHRLWVVAGGSRHVAVIDADLELVVDEVRLDDIAAMPYCVAFTSVADEVGKHAFVSQGPLIRVINTDSKAVTRNVDIGFHLGLPVQLLGCSGSRPREFQDGAFPVLRHYLHVAAQVEIAPTRWQPWFIVLDQWALALAPAGTDPIVAAGPLVPVPGGVEREAMDVDVLATRMGNQFQRAWYTVRETAPIPTLFAVQIAGGEQVTDGFAVTLTRATTSPGGTPLPDAIGVASPFSRELPGVAVPTTGRIVNLDTEGSCPVGDRPRSLAITGVGPGSYDVFVADIVDAGIPGLLHVFDGRTCTTENAVTTGIDPVDVVTLGPIDWQKAFVVNRGSDDVTVLRPDTSWGTIDIPPPTDGSGLTTSSTSSTSSSCTTCPQSAGMQLTSETACTIENLTMVEAGSDVDLSWTPVGCETGTWFEVWCVCDALAPSCPSPCVSGSDPCVNNSFEGCGTHVADGSWGPLGLTVGSFYTHVGAAGASVSYTVEPDDNQLP